ncbi:MAG: helix-turn-helix transcriptional regulator [Lachnospiraceae bacterium]|nr:helix-turn-helix transcriptional regulator [Lachnospiraceae bacterium]
MKNSGAEIHNVVQYIQDNYDKNITVTELAEMTGYSVSHFRRLFVKSYGVSPQEYIFQYKVQKAKELLTEEPEKSVEEIAELLGLYNAAHFCKMFKKKTGCSPGEYKEKYYTGKTSSGRLD